MKKLNVALVGCWHPHVPRYYPILQTREDTALSCVWDSTPERGRAWAEKLGVPFVANYEELLKCPDVDAICIVAETCRHAELMRKAAEAGKQVVQLAGAVEDGDEEGIETHLNAQKRWPI